MQASPDGPLTHFTSPRGEKCRLSVEVDAIDDADDSGVDR